MWLSQECRTFLSHASAVLFADADVDAVDEEQILTASQHQLRGYGSDKCSMYLFAEEAAWPAETCAWGHHAEESFPTR